MKNLKHLQHLKDDNQKHVAKINCTFDIDIVPTNQGLTKVSKFMSK